AAAPESHVHVLCDVALDAEWRNRVEGLPVRRYQLYLVVPEAQRAVAVVGDFDKERNGLRLEVLRRTVPGAGACFDGYILDRRRRATSRPRRSGHRPGCGCEVRRVPSARDQRYCCKRGQYGSVMHTSLPAVLTAIHNGEHTRRKRG